MTWTSLLSAGRVTLAACLISFSPALATSQQSTPQLSPSAPKDRPVETAQRCIWNAMEAAMQPYIAQARATWPAAKQRYMAGLPAHNTFFVTALIVDDSDRREQVFIAVDSIQAGKISGKIWNRVDIVHGYRLGDRYSLQESELRDWLITKPDGSEEGNYVGKFLDGYEPPRRCSTKSAS
jgi:hypothetical protein